MNIKEYLHKKVKFEIWSLLLFVVIIIVLLEVISISVNYLKPTDTPPSIEARLSETKWIIPSEEVKKEDGIVYPSNFDGSNIHQEKIVETPIAVVVENYTPIRSQQSGLEEALIVYETLAVNRKINIFYTFSIIIHWNLAC